VRGEPKARGETESTLRASRAAWISPPKTTHVPSGPERATATASSRFAGPSWRPGGADGAGEDHRAAADDVGQDRELLERVGARRDHHAAPGGGLPGGLADDRESVVEGQVHAGHGAHGPGPHGQSGSQFLGAQRRPCARLRVSAHGDRPARPQEGHLTCRDLSHEHPIVSHPRP
jgi:hypothetical protein